MTERKARALVLILAVLGAPRPSPAAEGPVYLFATPLSDAADAAQSKAADIMDVELQKHLMKSGLNWRKLDHAADTALLSVYRAGGASRPEPLPDRITATVEGGADARLIVVHAIRGTESEVPKGPVVAPVRGGIAVTREHNIAGKINRYDELFFTVTVFDPADGSVVGRSALHGVDMSDAVVNIVGFARNPAPREDAVGVELSEEQRERLSARYGSARALFITGSVFTFASAGIVVSGTSENVMPIGLTLFALGQSGLLTCGLSTLAMRSAVTEATRLPFRYSSAGFIVQGIGLAAMTGGFVMVGTGLMGSSGPLVLGGIASITAGEALTFVAWIPHKSNYNRMKRKIESLTVGPRLRIDESGRFAGGLGARLVF